MILDFIQKDILNCSENDINLQAMETAHVSLVSLLFRSEGFETYRCNRNINLGLNIASISTILKAAGNKDSLTINATDSHETISFLLESPNENKSSKLELKLMDLDEDRLGIPDTEYKCIVKMPSGELQRICRDLNQMGESITITVTKEVVPIASQVTLLLTKNVPAVIEYLIEDFRYIRYYLAPKVEDDE